MNEATKDLAYFQQQIAYKYGFGSIKRMLADDDYLMGNEAAELYAQYRYEQGKKEGEAKHEQLLSWLKSKSVYTLLRYGVKSPSSSGMDDCEDSDYYDLYNFVNELKQKQER